MGLRKAAKHYQIPKSTLSDRVAGKYKMGSKPGRPQKLSHDDEDDVGTIFNPNFLQGILESSEKTDNPRFTHALVS
jgi:hypothetical protein